MIDGRHSELDEKEVRKVGVVELTSFSQYFTSLCTVFLQLLHCFIASFFVEFNLE